jgi:hypothetical protein
VSNTKQEFIGNLNCDTVAWTLDILERYAEIIRLYSRFPSVSRMPEMAKYAALLELMEILRLGIDEDAKINVSPIEFRKTQDEKP